MRLMLWQNHPKMGEILGILFNPKLCLVATQTHTHTHVLVCVCGFQPLLDCVKFLALLLVSRNQDSDLVDQLFFQAEEINTQTLRRSFCSLKFPKPKRAYARRDSTILGILHISAWKKIDQPIRDSFCHGHFCDSLFQSLTFSLILKNCLRIPWTFLSDRFHQSKADTTQTEAIPDGEMQCAVVLPQLESKFKWFPKMQVFCIKEIQNVFVRFRNKPIRITRGPM